MLFNRLQSVSVKFEIIDRHDASKTYHSNDLQVRINAIEAIFDSFHADK